MAYLGKVKVGDFSPNHPWSHQPARHTCIVYRGQPAADLPPDSRRKVTGTSCPLCYGSIVELVGDLDEYQGRKDLAIIQHIAGNQCLLPSNDIGPVEDPKAAEQRAKYANFDMSQGVEDALAKMTPEEQEIARQLGF